MSLVVTEFSNEINFKKIRYFIDLTKQFWVASHKFYINWKFTQISLIKRINSVAERVEGLK